MLLHSGLEAHHRSLWLHGLALDRRHAMRISTLFTAGFTVAAAAFVATMLVSPPTTEASVEAPDSRTDAFTICEFLPTGDIAHCTIQN